MALLGWGFSEGGAGGFHDIRVATRVAGNHEMAQLESQSGQEKGIGYILFKDWAQNLSMRTSE